MESSEADAEAEAPKEITAQRRELSPARFLSGTEKAAIVLLVLGERYGGEIWTALDMDEVRTVTRAMARLGSVTAEAVEDVVAEFLALMSKGGGLTGDYDRTEALLMKLLPGDKVANLMEDIRGPAGRNVWQKLGNVQEQMLANYLKGEYPQTIAVVLSRLMPETAARALSLLPEEVAIETIHRMLNMEPVQKDVLNQLEDTLRTEFISNLTSGPRRDNFEMIAEIFNGLDRSTEAHFLAMLEERNRDAAHKVRSLMFTFEDLTNLDPASTQTLIRYADRDQLALALKGAASDVKRFFIGQMSTRAAKNLQDLMADKGPVRLKEIEENQMRLVMLAKELAAKGEITIGRNRQEDTMIY